MQWYKHYIADYLQDTADLSVMEHGVYRLLLDAYYQREGPLPCDLSILYRLCHAHSRHEKAAVRTVVGRFTETLNGHLRVSRADKEIIKYQQQCSANRRPNRVRIVDESEIELRERELRERKSKPNKSSATAATPAAQPRPLAKVAIGFDSNLGRFTGIAEADFLRWQDAYPAISVPDAVDQAAAWARANPANRKSNWERYLVNWFKRDQDRAGRAKP